MTTLLQPRRRRRNPTASKSGIEVATLPLVVRVLMRRFHLTPGMASAGAPAAGFSMEAR